jgi:hypothetical protein
LLPLCYADAQAGQRSAIMTCAEYAPLFEGCSYVDCIPFNGQPHELPKAYKEARAISSDVVVTQTLGDTETLKKMGQEKRFTDSFIKESWSLAGRLKDLQKNIPLVFDRRSPEREQALIESSVGGRKYKGKLSLKKSYYLIAPSGHSSPFPYRDLLFELIHNRFCKNTGGMNGGTGLIDLSKLKAERIYDLLPFYEQGHCLIAIDSAPLHLAMAVPRLPVVALVNDRPSYWHGSPWRKNHICTIRYSDFPERCIEMLDAITRINRPGSFFSGGVPGFKLIHVYSAYQLNGEHEHALETWDNEYVTGRWIHTPIERGAMGRDSTVGLKDPVRFPYLKDVLRAASMRAKDDDVIVLTRDHTACRPGITDKLTQDNPWYHHREMDDDDLHHPSVDLFAFTKKFWLQIRDQVPDLILGRDRNWDSVMLHIFKGAGAKELRGCIYRKASDEH